MPYQLDTMKGKWIILNFFVIFFTRADLFCSGKDM